jgi:hypothetical protein
MLSKARTAQVLGLSPSTVQETHSDVYRIAYELGRYEEIRDELRKEPATWDELSLEDRRLVNRNRPRHRTKRGKVEGPPRPWGEEERRALWEGLEAAGFQAFEDVGAVARIVWRKAGKDWNPAGLYFEGPAFSKPLEDILNWANTDGVDHDYDDDEPAPDEGDALEPPHHDDSENDA